MSDFDFVAHEAHKANTTVKRIIFADPSFRPSTFLPQRGRSLHARQSRRTANFSSSQRPPESLNATDTIPSGEWVPEPGIDYFGHSGGMLTFDGEAVGFNNILLVKDT